VPNTPEVFIPFPLQNCCSFPHDGSTVALVLNDQLLHVTTMPTQYSFDFMFNDFTDGPVLCPLGQGFVLFWKVLDSIIEGNDITIDLHYNVAHWFKLHTSAWEPQLVSTLVNSVYSYVPTALLPHIPLIYDYTEDWKLIFIHMDRNGHIFFSRDYLTYYDGLAFSPEATNPGLYGGSHIRGRIAGYSRLSGAPNGWVQDPNLILVKCPYDQLDHVGYKCEGHVNPELPETKSLDEDIFYVPENAPSDVNLLFARELGLPCPICGLNLTNIRCVGEYSFGLHPEVAELSDVIVPSESKVPSVIPAAPIVDILPSVPAPKLAPVAPAHAPSNWCGFFSEIVRIVSSRYVSLACEKIVSFPLDEEVDMFVSDVSDLEGSRLNRDEAALVFSSMNGVRVQPDWVIQRTAWADFDRDVRVVSRRDKMDVFKIKTVLVDIVLTERGKCWLARYEFLRKLMPWLLGAVVPGCLPILSCFLPQSNWTKFLTGVSCVGLVCAGALCVTGVMRALEQTGSLLVNGLRAVCYCPQLLSIARDSIGLGQRCNDIGLVSKSLLSRVCSLNIPSALHEIVVTTTAYATAYFRSSQTVPINFQISPVVRG